MDWLRRRRRSGLRLELGFGQGLGGLVELWRLRNRKWLHWCSAKLWEDRDVSIGAISGSFGLQVDKPLPREGHQVPTSKCQIMIPRSASVTYVFPPGNKYMRSPRSGWEKPKCSPEGRRWVSGRRSDRILWPNPRSERGHEAHYLRSSPGQVWSSPEQSTTTTTTTGWGLP